MEKGFSPIFLLVGIVIVAVVGLSLTQTNYLSNLYLQTPPTIVQPLPTPISDPIANWKTYTSVKYGYSLKYPDFLSIKEDQTSSFFDRSSKIDKTTLQGTFSGINFTNTVLTIDFVVEVNPKSLSTQDWVNYLKEKERVCESQKCDDFLYIKDFIGEDKNIQVGGRNGISKDLKGVSLSENIFVAFNSDKVLWIKRYYNTGFPEIEKEEKKIFDQILSKFKFTK